MKQQPPTPNRFRKWINKISVLPTIHPPSLTTPISHQYKIKRDRGPLQQNTASPKRGAGACPQSGEEDDVSTKQSQQRFKRILYHNWEVPVGEHSSSCGLVVHLHNWNADLTLVTWLSDKMKLEVGEEWSSPLSYSVARGSCGSTPRMKWLSWMKTIWWYPLSKNWPPPERIPAVKETRGDFSGTEIKRDDRNQDGISSLQLETIHWDLKNSLFSGGRSSQL